MIMQVYDDSRGSEKIGRQRCPFYGFSFSKKAKIFVDQKGNQCGLITDSYFPCKMEVKGRGVDWGECGFNNSNNLIMFEKLAYFNFFPREKPEGLCFEEWLKIVMR